MIIPLIGHGGGSDIYSQEYPYKISDCKGDNRHSEADSGHLKESLPEREILCHGDIEVENKDDKYGYQDCNYQA